VNLLLVALGFAVAGFGAWTYTVRFSNPLVYGRLEAMQETLGQTTGTMLHLVAFTLLPIAMGLMCINAGIRGSSLF
jgi:hypothetical protein